MTPLYILFSLIGLLFAFLLATRIKKNPVGTKKMEEIHTAIREGAMAFLTREYKVLSVFILIVFLILFFLFGILTGITFVAGSFLSALAGNIGMRTATTSNTRTAQACTESINKGLQIAFSSGMVMGLSVVSLGLLGITLLYLIVGDPNILYSFGFGASSIALFARVGGGIFTKAADVGADLVGKVERGIPEDDPRNPAVIADNVGDNVGDVAGMGADLFESYVDAIIAAMAIGLVSTGTYLVNLPLLIAGIGIISSIIGRWFVRTKEEKNIHNAMNKGIFVAAIMFAVLSYTAIAYITEDINIFYATLSGLIAGIFIGLITEYFTSHKYRPTQTIAYSSVTGAATNIISGFSVGMISTVFPILAVAGAISFSYYFAGLYGIAIAAVGMLSTLGITLAADTYGPVADNAAGIAEMAKMGKKIRERCEALDAVGNTTAAIGKGFAIGSAALTSLALFSAYISVADLKTISITNPIVIVGLFIGGMLPFIFSALTMSSVGKTAGKIVEEVRRQFKDKAIFSGRKKPDYKRCIDISTQAAIQQMILPAIITILAPIVVGIGLGPEALGGMLAGAIVTGFLLAITMANSGGAWDNAKKYIEAGNLGGKGSEPHKAAVVGDTVGDPFKDTSGPSLNILIKLMSIVALVFVPLML